MIAEKLKIDVRETDSLGDASGEVVARRDGPVIRVNSQESNLRQRFTVAHEIGHVVLGHLNRGETRRKRDTSAEFSLKNFDPDEAEANQFAAELLMPRVAVNALVKRTDHGLARLARAFEVSEVAMQYRLKNLGWVS
ncbi:MAG: ImmA/IrrE family metallo-endopeptidase [Pseudomonadota bacterium]